LLPITATFQGTPLAVAHPAPPDSLRTARYAAAGLLLLFSTRVTKSRTAMEILI